MVVEDLNARVEKVGQPGEIIDQCEENGNTNGVGMLKFLEDNEMKTLSDRAQKPEVQ